MRLDLSNHFLAKITISHENSFQLIAETLLYSEGFTDAAKLARKVVTVFVLSKEMLSNQQHYDWGLRALKTVLKGCGDLRAKNEEGKNEADIVVQVRK